MSGGGKRVYQLPDGTLYEVTDRQIEAITELTEAVERVARGDVINLAIVQNDGSKTCRKALFSFTENTVGLGAAADALFWLMKLARQVAASWEGNAQGEARSYVEH